MAYQGRGPFDELENFEIPEDYRSHFFLDDPVGGEHMNIMKAGIITASRVVAVSGGYSWEIQTQEGGWGLHEVLQEQNWKLSGIVNGIDYNDWHPRSDEFLTSDGYTQYDIDNMLEGKRQNKIALQREMGLPENPDVPLLGFIGRMDYQKGVDLIQESFDWLMGEGVQLVMLGSGRDDLENALRNMEEQRKDQCRCAPMPALFGMHPTCAWYRASLCTIGTLKCHWSYCDLYGMHLGAPASQNFGHVVHCTHFIQQH